MDKLLTMKEIQEITRLGRSGTYNLVKRPDFPKIMIGKKILCYENDLDNYLKDYKYGRISV